MLPKPMNIRRKHRLTPFPPSNHISENILYQNDLKISKYSRKTKDFSNSEILREFCRIITFHFSFKLFLEMSFRWPLQSRECWKFIWGFNKVFRHEGVSMIQSVTTIVTPLDFRSAIKVRGSIFLELVILMRKLFMRLSQITSLRSWKMYIMNRNRACVVTT